MVRQNENPFAVTARSLSEARSALSELERAMRPLPDDELRRELVALHAMTVRRAESETDLRLVLELYARELRGFPADVARDALRGWPGRFFPAWAELRDRLLADRRPVERRQRIAALREFIERGGAPEERRGPPPTEEQRARLRRWLKNATGARGVTWTDDQLAALARVDREHPEARMPGPDRGMPLYAPYLARGEQNGSARCPSADDKTAHHGRSGAA